MSERKGGGTKRGGAAGRGTRSKHGGGRRRGGGKGGDSGDGGGPRRKQGTRGGQAHALQAAAQREARHRSAGARDAAAETHEDLTTAAAPGETKRCSFWLQHGRCRYEAKCKYVHASAMERQAQASHDTQLRVTLDKARGTRSVTERRFAGAQEQREASSSGGSGEDARYFPTKGLRAGCQVECPQWKRTGGCRYGHSCKYVHPKQAHPATAPRQPKKKASTSKATATSAAAEADGSNWRKGGAPRSQQGRSRPDRRGPARRQAAADASSSPSSSSGGRSGGGGGGGRRRRSRFKEWLDVADAKRQVEEGLLVEAELRVNRFNRRDAYVTIEGFPVDIKLEGESAQNRAIHGDWIAIRLLPKSKWKVMSDDDSEGLSSSEEEEEGEEEEEDIDVASDAAEDEDADAITAAMQGLTVADDSSPKQYPAVPLADVSREDLFTEDGQRYRPFGEVVCVLEARHKEEYIGYLQSSNRGEDAKVTDDYAFFVPFDKRIPRILVPLSRVRHSVLANADLSNDLFLCRMKQWRVTSNTPFGALVKNFGKGGDLEVEKRILLEANNITYDEGFSAAVNRCLPSDDWSIGDDELARRMDLRHLRVCSIDPATAKDLDDALSIEHLDNGNYRVGVHIADVTHFVRPGTALDKEARERACTIYLVDRSIPMLPRILSERLCSLNMGSDSIAFTVLITLTPQGKVVSREFGKSVIRSSCQMSYGMAQSMLDGTWQDAPEGEIRIDPALAHRVTVEQMVADVRALDSIARQRRERRFRNGSLSLNSVKIGFRLDAETGAPLSVHKYVGKPANALVEEFMLLANEEVAKYIHRVFPNEAVLRRHPPPSEKIRDFAKLCSTYGIRIDVSSSKALHRSLQAVNDAKRPWLQELLGWMAMRNMQQAKYTPTSAEDPEGAYHHYALNMDEYTHFTSPIRRYPDVMVHRLLQCAIMKEPSGERKEVLMGICDNANEKKYAADRASERSDVVFLCHLLKDKPLEVDAVVFAVTQKGFSVLSLEYGIDGNIFVADLGCSSTAHDSDANTWSLTWGGAKKGSGGGGSGGGDDGDDADEDRVPLDETTIVYVGNLPFETTRDELLSVCDGLEPVDAAIAQRPKDGRSRGFGFVQFATNEAARKALALEGKRIGVRLIHVELSHNATLQQTRRPPRKPRKKAQGGGGNGKGEADDASSSPSSSFPSAMAEEDPNKWIYESSCTIEMFQRVRVVLVVDRRSRQLDMTMKFVRPRRPREPQQPQSSDVDVGGDE